MVVPIGEPNTAEISARTPLGGKRLDVSEYDVVFIGYSIWREQAPRLINTFIESHNLKGKTVIPFATSGGSTISGSAATFAVD